MNKLSELIEGRQAKIGIIGLGYVGLPLAIRFLERGFNVIGYDIDSSKITALNAGKSYINHIDSKVIHSSIKNSTLEVTNDETKISEMDAIIICVPTPIDKYRVPDLKAVLETTETISRNISKNSLVCLESSTYPQTTSHELKPILDKSNLQLGDGYYLCYSPEREDPGNKDFSLHQIPKVLGSDDKNSLECGKVLYESIIDSVHIVSSSATAEAVKLTENIFRAVNISLSNELKIIYGEMGIDAWEVIDAASTKPFGFMPFYPGPGVGGHCIPIDPFYLTYKAKEFGLPTRFIELAGEYNNLAIEHIISKISFFLNQRIEKSISNSKILLLGLAYKKNIDDMRESPSVHILEKLLNLGGDVYYNDDFIKVFPKTREHLELAGMKSIELSKENISSFDACVLLTDHDYYDEKLILKNSKLVLDTRNFFKSKKENSLVKI